MAWLIRIIIDVVIGKISDLIGALIAKFKRDKKIESDVKADIDQLKKAESLDERKEAVKDLTGHF